MNDEQQAQLLSTIKNQHERIGQLENLIQDVLQNQPSTSYKLKPPKPETFSGHQVDTFIFAIEKAFDYHQTLEQQRVSTAVMYFRDAALRWYKSIELKYKDTDQLQQWNQFKLLVTSHFKANNTESIIRNKLNALQQKYSVSSYNDQFNGLIVELVQMDEGSKIDAYCRGLKKQILIQVKISRPATLEAAQSTALEMDNIMNQADGIKSYNNNSLVNNRRHYNSNSSSNNQQHSNSNSNSSYNSVPMDIGNVESELDELSYVNSNSNNNNNYYNNRLNDHERQELFRDRKCFKCKRVGHIARNCRSSLNQLNQQAR
jgi:Retrotransposon gag protein/Zinc knuckle